MIQSITLIINDNAIEELFLYIFAKQSFTVDGVLRTLKSGTGCYGLPCFFVFGIVLFKFFY
jgi:hypothetical protein